jgi:glycosyltransferase involved in cell wall biosynthesis
VKISAVMIVKNEEEVLERCLESIKWVDDIVICDTGSTDKTIEIANSYTHKVFTDYKWNDNFSEARNHAMGKAKGNWILTIDADEYLLPNQEELIRNEIENADDKLTLDVIMDSGYSTFYSPRLTINDLDEVYYKGAVHNYLNIAQENHTNIIIHYDYGPSHKKDPDRTLRILEKEVAKDPTKPRELFYLAREYWYYDKYYEAIFYFEKYVSLADWAPEWAEAYYFLSRCYEMIDENDKAKNACLMAIKINADYRDALLLMARLCGPNNRSKWLEYAQYAEDKFVLTSGMPPEREDYYYDNLFKNDSDMSRYEDIYRKVGEWVNGEPILDIGCGVGALREYVMDWHGFDFSKVAIETANSPYAWVGNVYDKNNFEDDYGYYVALEVLEHLDDFRVLHNIPTGKKVIFSVPSFEDTSHLRTYNEEIVRIRYKHFIDIDEIIRFNWRAKRWKEGGKDTSDFILLVRGTRI